MKKEQKHIKKLYWCNYKEIALALHDLHPDIDIMTTDRNKLIQIITELPAFCEKEKKPDQYILDDIRFEWFFKKKEASRENGKWRLSSNF